MVHRSYYWIWSDVHSAKWTEWCKPNWRCPPTIRQQMVSGIFFSFLLECVIYLCIIYFHQQMKCTTMAELSISLSKLIWATTPKSRQRKVVSYWKMLLRSINISNILTKSAACRNPIWPKHIVHFVEIKLKKQKFKIKKRMLDSRSDIPCCILVYPNVYKVEQFLEIYKVDINHHKTRYRVI